MARRKSIIRRHIPRWTQRRGSGDVTATKKIPRWQRSHVNKLQRLKAKQEEEKVKAEIRVDRAKAEKEEQDAALKRADIRGKDAEAAKARLDALVSLRKQQAAKSEKNLENISKLIKYATTRKLEKAKAQAELDKLKEDAEIPTLSSEESFEAEDILKETGLIEQEERLERIAQAQGRGFAKERKKKAKEKSEDIGQIADIVERITEKDKKRALAGMEERQFQ